MPSTQILDHEHQTILEEVRAARLAAERRFRVPGCPWGCDGSGWRLVEDDQDQETHFLDVIAHGQLWTPCECNSRLVLRDGRYQTEVRVT